MRAGTYVETIDFGGKAIALIGIDGPEETTIDADRNDSVVRFIQGEGREAILSGFTITGGRADNGGGIRIEGAAPRLYHLRILDNRVWGRREMERFTNDGGGIFVSHGAPILTDVTLAQNVTDLTWCVLDNGNGGGLYAMNGSHLFMDSVVFQDHHAGDYGDSLEGCQGGRGGAIFLRSSFLFLRRGTFVRNQAGKGRYYWDRAAEGGDGGAISAVNSLLEVIDTEFRDNEAGEGGSGIIEGGSAYPGCDGGDGGAISMRDSWGLVEGSIFLGNRTGDGGSGGVSSNDESDVAGDAGRGGAIFVSGGQIDILETLLVANRTGDGGVSNVDVGNGGGGGGLYAKGARVHSSNLIVMANRTGDGGDGASTSDWYCDRYWGHIGAPGGNGGGIALIDSIAELENLTLFRNETGKGGDGGDLYSDCVEDPYLPGEPYGDVYAGDGGPGGAGAGLYLWGGSVSMRNVTMTENETGPGGAGGTFSGEAVGHDGNEGMQGRGGGLAGYAASFTYNHAWGNLPDDYSGMSDPTGTEGNITGDPRFVDTSGSDPLAWDLHLSSDSP
ncbi:MAG: hypothetical protein D6795_04405, partial [Deltaproteobacteria bacterium]